MSELEKDKVEVRLTQEEDDSLSSETISSVFPNLDGLYQCLELIAQGGMGSVYKAKETGTGRIVAIKVIKADLAKDPVAQKRFQQEVQALSEVGHDNIVAVYDHGITSEGTPYLVMQYLQGTSLSNLLKGDEVLEPLKATRVAIEICKALSHAHKHNLIHRDIKPGNVIVQDIEAEPPTVQVVDFGISKITEATSGATTNLTQTGEVFGTPDYMSPEQCLGKEVDHRSDIYSFGCLFYEMLTGQPPFKSNQPIQTVAKHLGEIPPDLTDQLGNSTLTVNLRTVVYQCLLKDPGDRYQSVEHLQKDLSAVLRGAPLYPFKGHKQQVLVAGSGFANPEEKKKAQKTLGAFGIFLGIIMIISVCSVNNEMLFNDPDLQSTATSAVLAFTGIFGLVTTIRPFLANLKGPLNRTWEEWIKTFWFIFQVATFASGFLLGFMGSSFANNDAVIFVSSFVVWLAISVVAVINFFVPRKERVVPLSTALKGLATLLAGIVISSFVFASQTASFAVTLSKCVAVPSPAVAGKLARLANKFDSTNPIPYAVIAATDRKLGDSKGSLSILDEGLKRISGADVAYLYAERALSLDKLNRGTEALNDAHKALQFSNLDVNMEKIYGDLLFKDGQVDEAIKSYSTILDGGKHRQTNMALAVVARQRGLAFTYKQEYRKALADFSYAIEKESSENDRIIDYVRRAVLYDKLAEPTGAVSNLNRVLEVSSDGSDEELLLTYAAKTLKTNDHKASMNTLSKSDRQRLEEMLFPGIPIEIPWEF